MKRQHAQRRRRGWVVERRFVYEAGIGVLIAVLLLWVALTMNGNVPFVYQRN
ncbi:MAG: hypothetical protein M3Y91_15875 [Actinomycetota bacterium]|nr:hypothetical protein [Actinomycetota bacterium]